ncbi:hypothetical protein CFT9_21633 [Pseudomonas sp. CFT9]|nr:hypothetical protein CFT9_21633 [Pseudomonas sp. CFT9]EPL06789.1 hypothetical protein CF150_25599 [Pseudomonas sp. CF150]
MLDSKTLRQIIRGGWDHLKTIRPTLHLGKAFGADNVDHQSDSV